MPSPQVTARPVSLLSEAKVPTAPGRRRPGLLLALLLLGDGAAKLPPPGEPAGSEAPALPPPPPETASIAPSQALVPLRLQREGREIVEEAVAWLQPPVEPSLPAKLPLSALLQRAFPCALAGEAHPKPRGSPQLLPYWCGGAPSTTTALT